jgi:hypothetical protein
VQGWAWVAELGVQACYAVGLALPLIASNFGVLIGIARTAFGVKVQGSSSPVCSPNMYLRDSVSNT